MPKTTKSLSAKLNSFVKHFGKNILETDDLFAPNRRSFTLENFKFSLIANFFYSSDWYTLHLLISYYFSIFLQFLF